MDNFGKAICGDIYGPFWDRNVTWCGSKLDFTPCFKDTALFWIPSFIFWILFPFEVMAFYKCRGYPTKSSIAYIQLACQLFTTILFFGLTILNLTLWQMQNIVWFWMGFVSYTFYIATMVAIIILSWEQMREGFTGSAAIWLSLFFSVICGTFRLYSEIEENQFDPQTSADTTAPDVLFIIYYIFCIATLIAYSFSSVPTPNLLEEIEQEPFSYDFCSFPNRFAFAWVIPMLWKGYKQDLAIKDIWSSHPTERSSYLMSRYDKIIRKEFASVVESKRFTNGISPDAVQVKIPRKSPSLMKILTKEFGGTAAITGILDFINVILIFVEPVVIGLLTSFATNIHTEQDWHGYVYALVLACALFSRSCLEPFAWFKMVRLGRTVNSILVGCIYRKALRLSSEARKASTVGEIVNLMSVDAGRFFDFALDMHTVWTAPLQFIFGFYLAYRQVGVAVWAGIGYILALSIINGLVSGFYERLQEKQMELKDDRVKLLSEVLNGVKVIKLYGWEPAFQHRIGDIRLQELRRLRQVSFIGAFYEFTWNSTSLGASLAVLATYVALSPDHSLRAEPVFVILSIFNILTMPLSLMPAILAHFAMIRVSLKRLGEYFSSQELEEDQIQSETGSELAVKVENGTFSWDSNVGPALHDISVHIPHGKLVAVVGKVGSGKSSLLNALCGEMHKIGGMVNVEGSIGYVSQQAWIQNMTLKDNILFGKILNERNYNSVIESCCLKPDLEALPTGDQTEIGERGINLSGGQKQRVNLARAVYQNQDIYLLDDPLSAVDVHVGKHIFENVIGDNGILKDKTRILVTHALTYLPKCDLVLVMDNGRIQDCGTFNELIEKQGAFADFIQQYLTEASVEELADLQAPEFEALESIDAAKQALRIRFSSQSSQEESDRSSLSVMESILHRLASVSSEHSDKEEIVPLLKSDPGKLIDPEVMQIGQVTWSVYGTYAKSAGAGFLLYVVFMVFMFVFEMLGNIWLQKWSDNSQRFRRNQTTVDIPVSTGLLYLGLCGLGQMMFTLLLGMALAIFQVKAAKLIHDKLLAAILRAPMAFFDTTPAGRIINRCGKDINTVDNDVPNSVNQFCQFIGSLLYGVIGLFIYIPIFGAVLLPAAVVYIVLQRVYISAARRVRRLEAVTSSPIYSHFQETLSGISTIRAFQHEQRFSDLSDQLVDIRVSAQMTRSLFNRWVQVYMNLVGCLLVTATVFTVVYMVINGEMTAGVAGLTLSSFALHLPAILSWGVYVASMLEMQMVSLERIMEYTGVKPEAPWTFPVSITSNPWPSHGRVLFRQYGTRYRDGLPLVLRDFSADIQANEKVGIVGRTGAGKSSLTLALFRIIEASEGSILIDDVDIGRLGLHQLRRNLTIIPQDPVLFSGTLRMNLDPFNEHSDEDLWTALERSRLKEYVSNLANAFEHEVDEGGSNLSVGQRQLVCLARALLRKSKILILDEATAAIDVETDSWIQSTIRDQFKDCTIITIAHRLNTILDSDKIMVLEDGGLVEFDSPATLAEKEDGLFAAMLKEANLTTT